MDVGLWQMLPFRTVAAAVSSAAKTPAAATIIKAYNEQDQFPNVVKIWATDDVIAELKGPFAAYDQFKDVPQALRAAPDAKTWAGVQLWLWWAPPKIHVEEDRLVCYERRVTVWTVMLSAHKASEVLDLLPDLEPELWLLVFEFVKHVEAPTYV